MHAIRVLEFPTIQEKLGFHCETPMAAASAGELKPTFERAEVWSALGLTTEAHRALAKHSPPALGSIGDPRDQLTFAAKGGTLAGAELFRIAEGMLTIRSLKSFLQSRLEDLPRLCSIGEALTEHQRLEQQLLDGIEPDGTVKDAASAALGSLRARKRTHVQRIQERIQSYVTGKARDLLSDPIYTVRDGRYVLPLKSENRGKIKGIIHDTSSSGQTVFLEPEDVLQLGNTLRETEAAERTEVQRLLIAWSAKVGAVAMELSSGIEAASQIDFAFAKARLAYEMKAAEPRPSKTPHYLSIHGGRHPLLDPTSAVPLDIGVGSGSSVLITGPNTGGKTVAIKCVGLFVLMAQSGLYVPALDAELGPFTQVWADIGDEQSLQQSLSTFSGHVKNIAEALKDLEEGALVLLDEIGAGTDPAEGAALAASILTALSEGGAAVLASTHYGELKTFAYNKHGFTNAGMEFDTKTLRPTYRLIMGAPGASQALRVAERYGISKSIIGQAKEHLKSDAHDMAKMLERLEVDQRLARQAQGEADRLSAELRTAEKKANKKLEEADEIRRTAHARANEVIEAALREIRLEAAKLFDEIKKGAHDTRALDKARLELRTLDELGRDFAGAFLPPKRQTIEGDLLKKGGLVQVSGLTQLAEILELPRDGQVQVLMGRIKMTVPVDRLMPVTKPANAAVAPKHNLQLQKAMSASTEIDIRHQRVEDALRNLERFLDDAVLAGLPTLRIVHGKGEGILRKATQELLKSHRGVATFRDGDATEGGHGVTIASLA